MFSSNSLQQILFPKTSFLQHLWTTQRLWSCIFSKILWFSCRKFYFTLTFDKELLLWLALLWEIDVLLAVPDVVWDLSIRTAEVCGPETIRRRCVDRLQTAAVQIPAKSLAFGVCPALQGNGTYFTFRVNNRNSAAGLVDGQRHLAPALKKYKHTGRGEIRFRRCTNVACLT